ncbi:MAG TPA: glycosyltransferase [Chthoniobacteraceae bacterium]
MPMPETPLVTVSLITYNHAPYIEQAIRSVLAQRTNFPFELLIGDDESTDGTREIVQRFAAENPDRIRLLLHSKSNNVDYRGRPTGNNNFAQNIRSARGKYIANLDGDDYWTHRDKLQRQVDFLEKHSEYAVCFHRNAVVDEHDARLDVPSSIPVAKQTYVLAEYLELQFLPWTCTLLSRRGLFGEFPDWYLQSPVGDFPVNVMNALHGDFGFIDAEMAAYRIHPGGFWSMGLKREEWVEKSRAQQERQALRWKDLGMLYYFLDGYLGTAYRPIIRRKIAEFATSEAGCYRSLGDNRAMRKSLWKAAVAQAEISPRKALRCVRLLIDNLIHPVSAASAAAN